MILGELCGGEPAESYKRKASFILHSSEDPLMHEIEQIRLLLCTLFNWDHVGQCGRQLGYG